MSDSDYSPAYQDEYQRLWHKSAARVQELEAENDRLRRQVYELDEAETRESNAAQILRKENERLRDTVQELERQQKMDEAQLSHVLEEWDIQRRRAQKLEAALQEAERTFSTLLELSLDNRLWKNVASVGEKDARAALASQRLKETT